MDDKLVNCPHCEAEMCYEYPHSNYTQWMCFNCGYGSTSMMEQDSDFVKANKEVLPELIKDLEFVDKNNLVWYPSTINIPEKGILFPNGNSKESWGWSIAPLVKIPKNEKSRFPKGQTHKVDLNGIENFDKEEFAAAVVKLNSL